MNVFFAASVIAISFIAGGCYLIVNNHPWFGAALLICAACTTATHQTKL